VNDGALIIGSSPAGIQAALDLADSGICVHLITSSPFLEYSEGNCEKGFRFNDRLLEIAKHPLITLWTNTRFESAQKEPGSIRITLYRSSRYVDVSKCTACGDCIDACPVTVPETDRKAVYLVKGAQPECAVIDKQGIAPCTDACPGGIPVQGYVALIAQGRYREALELIEKAIPLPEICGRVCMHPCEDRCRRSEVDAPVSIRALKRFVADYALRQPTIPQAEKITIASDAKQVAIVGSGPAGITAADSLTRMGYRVTVFEKQPVFGGMMAIGIPAYRLPREVIAREYGRIQERGVEIRLNTTIGSKGDYCIDDLFDMGFSAVCIAIGAHRSLKLHIPQENLPGVVHGLELLKIISLSQQTDDPSHRTRLNRILSRGQSTRAVVLGGGNTAMDTARSLKRLGVSDVRILYRRSRKEMPALPEEIEETEKEGISIEFLVAPVRILGDDTTGVRGIECVRMKLSEPDYSGRRRPVPVAGSEFKVDADLVVPAIGQVPDIDAIDGIATTRHGRIRLSASGFMTSRPGVFAAGDAVTRDKMSVIDAIGMGKKAALEIDAYLKGTSAAGVREPSRHLSVVQSPLGGRKKDPAPRLDIPTVPIERRMNNFNAVEKGYTETQARIEAGRCLACGPCSECMACAAVCKPDAINHYQRDLKTTLAVAAIIYADSKDGFNDLPLTDGYRVYRAAPERSLEGSAAAAKVMYDVFGKLPRKISGIEIEAAHPDKEACIGVFVCRCGEEISKIIDTQALCRHASEWPDVVYTTELEFSCSSEAAEIIDSAVKEYRLNRIVMAACSCCSLDQVCLSCTYQRVRCKKNLGLFGSDVKGRGPDHTSVAANRLAVSAFEFVNIREHCAWAHADDPKSATAKATAMVAASVAKARLAVESPLSLPARTPAVLLIGSGKAARFCLEALKAQGIYSIYLAEVPYQIRHGKGHYVALTDGKAFEGTGVVFAPRDWNQLDRLQAALGDGDRLSLRREAGSGVEARTAGLFVCNPDMDAEVVGTAAAARVSAWLGRLSKRRYSNAAVVDARRCRACHGCVDICEFSAAVLVNEKSHRYAWIDPALCTGCGSCVARCPSGAIKHAGATDEQLSAMIHAVLTP